nr:putative serpin-Z12 [Aegilops tauschii subsp. strangulata]
MRSLRSFHAAVALVAAGARGYTQRELLQFLGSPSLGDLQRTAATATKLVGKLGGLTWTCGVRIDQSWPPTPEFMVAAASSGCGTASKPLRCPLTSWTQSKRGGNVLPAGSVNLTTAVALVDALDFKGTWSQLFEPVAAASRHLPSLQDSEAAPTTATRTMTTCSKQPHSTCFYFSRTSPPSASSSLISTATSS